MGGFGAGQLQSADLIEFDVHRTEDGDDRENDDDKELAAKDVGALSDEHHVDEADQEDKEDREGAENVGVAEGREQGHPLSVLFGVCVGADLLALDTGDEFVASLASFVNPFLDLSFLV